MQCVTFTDAVVIHRFRVSVSYNVYITHRKTVLDAIIEIYFKSVRLSNKDKEKIHGLRYVI